MSSISATGIGRESVNPLWTGLLVGGLLFLPGAIGFYVEDSSFSWGTTVMCIAGLILAGLGQIPRGVIDVQSTMAAILVVGVMITLHLLIAYIINDDPRFDVLRALLSLLLLGIIIFSVAPMCEAIMVDDGAIRTVARILCAFFVIIAVSSLLGIQPPSPVPGAKPTFPYSEPSFLGFSMPAVLIFVLIRSPMIYRVFIISLFFLLGYLIGNFTIIAACMLAAVATLPMLWIAAGSVVAIISMAGIDLSYYLDRLDFDWSSSFNLSSLSYVQGWQLLQEALLKTYYWGLGFQQLGIGYNNVPASYRINFLLGRDANLQDGSFFLAKLGGEFGIFGLALVVGYLVVAAKSFIRLRAVLRGKLVMMDGELFARCCVIGYLIEIIVRGTGYFAGTSVLLLAGLFYLFRTRSGPATQIGSVA